MPSSKRLFILRHAKSSWDDPGLADHDRPLAPRGRRAVEAIAAHLNAEGIMPELVLCSSARRTRETLEGAGVGGEHLIEPDLYGANCQEVLERLHRVPEEIGSVMVVGHNPTLQALVLHLADDDAAINGSYLVEVRRKFPTGALATLTFDGAWQELSPRSARLASYVRPKSLAF
ncbi:MAG TPA: histidine phosphatase family protein [Solirubrobacteraceae bacterium]|nr:histidine phosphatase family protein [Solirubrobacteraceae bacterium]